MYHPRVLWLNVSNTYHFPTLNLDQFLR
ncbi:MAG: hypothetical protein QOG83_1495, partial [Alphaproteobacteria bacterium]|nr:hypothetical protein [Alphaproteobacteria bacterium]